MRRFPYRPFSFIVMALLTLIFTQCGTDIVAEVGQGLQEEGVNNDDNMKIDSEGQDISHESLEIFVVDVGQGDATLILGPKTNGQQVSLLIDAGPLDPDGGAIIKGLFAALGLDHLDHLILTHYDADHMGGLVTTYNSQSLVWDENCQPSPYFPSVSIVDLGPTDKDTTSVQEYSHCLRTNQSVLGEGHYEIGSTPHLNMGQQIDLGGGFYATIVAGNGDLIDGSSVGDVDTDNEKSIAVLVSGPADFDFLVTGDLTGVPFGNEDAPVEEALGRALNEMGISIEILRTGHHGSASSSSPEFLNLITPQVAIISVGDNPHGHPHCETLKNLQAASEWVIQTGEGSTKGECPEKQESLIAHGTIRISVTAQGFVISRFP